MIGRNLDGVYDIFQPPSPYLLMTSPQFAGGWMPLLLHMPIVVVTWGTLSLGKGAVYSMSSKQRLILEVQQKPNWWGSMMSYP